MGALGLGGERGGEAGGGRGEGRGGRCCGGETMESGVVEEGTDQWDAGGKKRRSRGRNTEGR